MMDVTTIQLTSQVTEMPEFTPAQIGNNLKEVSPKFLITSCMKLIKY